MKNLKKWLIAATCLVVVGLIIFAAAMTVKNWNFDSLSTSNFEINVTEISQEVTDILIDTDTADIAFLKSESDKCRVICFEDQKEKHLVTVENGILKITLTNSKKWYEYIGINFHSPKITVYLPKEEYNSISVDSSTSDISLSNLKLNSLEIGVSTGDIALLDMDCKEEAKITVSTGKMSIERSNFKNLSSTGSTGDVTLKTVFCSEKLSITRSTGDIKFEALDAGEIFIETDTGDVKGTLLGEKLITATSSTGKVIVPNSSSGGKFETSTNTGDIIIALKN